MPGERTEKPTPRRLEKARKEGNYVSSRELLAAGQFLIFVAMLSLWSLPLLSLLMAAMRASLTFHRTPEVDALEVTARLRGLAFTLGLPVLAAGGCMALLPIAMQLGLNRFGFALNKITPDITRLNPMRRLASLPGQNFPALLQAVILIPFCLLVVWQFSRSHVDSFLALSYVPPVTGFAFMATTVRGLLWKAGFVLLVLGIVDIVRQKRSWTKRLMMSKQEIREEGKETEGNPQIKMRIRRIQRDIARRSMMKEIPKATAVVVNPTHYAVAIRYDLGSMAAPKVVAKGKNYLALRIRKVALEHQVPIVENRPLAQGLYNAVEVGQEIPAHLYKAVAEILAYIYRLVNPKGRPA